MTRDVLFTQSAQPFIIAGSGTLGWDEVRSTGNSTEVVGLKLSTGCK
jgi:alanine-glyoxylate transaminase / serine-glyoxylate transaminase / serine-pyruvate transaminase